MREKQKKKEAESLLFTSVCYGHDAAKRPDARGGRTSVTCVDYC